MVAGHIEKAIKQIGVDTFNNIKAERLEVAEGATVFLETLYTQLDPNLEKGIGLVDWTQAGLEKLIALLPNDAHNLKAQVSEELTRFKNNNFSAMQEAEIKNMHVVNTVSAFIKHRMAEPLSKALAIGTPVNNRLYSENPNLAINVLYDGVMGSVSNSNTGQSLPFIGMEIHAELQPYKKLANGAVLLEQDMPQPLSPKLLKIRNEIDKIVKQVMLETIPENLIVQGIKRPEEPPKNKSFKGFKPNPNN